MNAKQKRIFDWFKQVEEGLAELYGGAVRLIADTNFPGRGRLICHAVREIRNRLPDAVAGKGISSRLEYRQEVDKLANVYERSGFGSIRGQTTNVGSEQQPGQEVFVLMEQLIKKHRKVKSAKGQNAKRLLMEIEPDNRQWQQSLVPVVEKWIEETEWFVERAHEGKQIDVKRLIQRFTAFEEVLLSLVDYFYEGLQELENLVEETNRNGKKPDEEEVDRIVRRLGRAKYRIYFFDKLDNPNWIEPLSQRGFFQSPGKPEEGEAYESWPEGIYLKKMALRAPEKVLKLISKIQYTNPYVRNTCIECLLEMPESIAEQGVGIIEKILPRGVEEVNMGWTWYGEPAAKLMVKLADQHKEKFFMIAWLLLDAWILPSDTSFRSIRAKFSDRHYKELVLKYFCKLWEVDARKALWIMVKIPNRCLEQLDERQGYDVSSLAYVQEALRDLDSIDVGRWGGIQPVLVKGICEAGKLVARDDSSKLSELLDEFEKLGRAIFLRIEMYLLRFVGTDVETIRINRIIAEKKYLGDPCYENEYKLLLRDKFEVVKESRKVFEAWVEEQKIEDLEDWQEWFNKTRHREANEEDVKKYIAGMKARQLFLVKEKYVGEYAKYQSESGLTDADLAPRPMVSEARPTSSMESTPLSMEDMGKMNCDEVLDYVLEPSHYEKDVKKDDFHRDSPKYGLAETLKNDIKQRPIEYLSCDLRKLERLGPYFLSRLFYGLHEAIREKGVERDLWVLALKLASDIVKKNGANEEYGTCFSAILSTFHDSFSSDEKGIEFNPERIKSFWEMLEILTKYPVGDMSRFGDDEKDPVQIMCNLVPGQAVELSVPLRVVCKNNFGKLHDGYLTSEIRRCYERILNSIRDPGVNCTFGYDFARIYWTDGEWTENNVEKIFCGELWDETWGTYVSWGRPSPNSFKCLVEKGIYAKAMEKIGDKNKYEFSKKQDEGLVEHLMIAVFNGWIDINDPLLEMFLQKASIELRSHAVQFLTTGFKSVKEEEKDHQEITQRLRAYWQKRLSAMKEKPSDNIEEAREFAGWVTDSLLEPKETLELLKQTLDISQGKLGKMLDTQEFIDSVCDLGKGNELIALRCLKKAAAEKEMRMLWASYQDRLIEFLELIVNLPDDYENVENIRAEAINVADTYGRLHSDQFREIWEKLSAKAGQT